MKEMLSDEFRIGGISDTLFCPFKINQDIEMTLNEMDPNMRFYSTNMTCITYLTITAYINIERGEKLGSVIMFEK